MLTHFIFYFYTDFVLAHSMVLVHLGIANKLDLTLSVILLNKYELKSVWSNYSNKKYVNFYAFPTFSSVTTYYMLHHSFLLVHSLFLSYKCTLVVQQAAINHWLDMASHYIKQLWRKTFLIQWQKLLKLIVLYFLFLNIYSPCSCYI